MSRYLLLVILLFTASCYGPPINLTKPLCFVIPQKPTDRSQELALHDAIVYGTSLWIAAIPADIPIAIITNNINHCSNPPIIVELKKFNNPGKGMRRCGYTNPKLDRHIIQLSPDERGLNSVVFAHELGHIIWAYSHIKNRPSIMNPKDLALPTSADIKMICNTHRELRCRKY